MISFLDLTNAMPEVELTGTLAIGSVTESLRPFFEEYLTTQVNNQNSGTRGTLPNKKSIR